MGVSVRTLHYYDKEKIIELKVEAESLEKQFVDYIREIE